MSPPAGDGVGKISLQQHWGGFKLLRPEIQKNHASKSINRDLSPTKNLRTMIKGPRPQKLSIQGPNYNPGKSIKEEKK